jgi:hypothetical protein
VPKETDLLIEVFVKLSLDIEIDENKVLADSACIQSKALDQLKSNSRLVDRAKIYAIDDLHKKRRSVRDRLRHGCITGTLYLSLNMR